MARCETCDYYCSFTKYCESREMTVYCTGGACDSWRANSDMDLPEDYDPDDDMNDYD